MFGNVFYHEHLRKYVILFGTIFNDIWINRKDNDGNVKQSFKVPISYGPREKFLARIEGDPTLDQAFAIVLPRLGFQITGYSYAAERKLPTIRKFVNESDTNDQNKKFLYNPVPYDINFQLSVFAKNIEDGLMIVEQILPYFTPEWTTTVRLIDDPDITLDIPIILNSTTSDDVYEGSFEERRAIIWDLDFTLKGYLFGPTKRTGIIRTAFSDLYGDIPE